jgi:hypothetical protein
MVFDTFGKRVRPSLDLFSHLTNKVRISSGARRRMRAFSLAGDKYGHFLNE